MGTIFVPYPYPNRGIPHGLSGIGSPLTSLFVTLQGGNFPHFLKGHMRYMFGGNAKTRKPDNQKLVLSFDDSNVRLV
jgi:hypothetical protein